MATPAINITRGGRPRSGVLRKIVIDFANSELHATVIVVDDYGVERSVSVNPTLVELSAELNLGVFTAAITAAVTTGAQRIYGTP